MSTTTAPATTATIGQELVGLCRQGRNGDAIERLYSKDIVSIEPSGSEAMPAETKGMTGHGVERSKHFRQRESRRSRCESHPVRARGEGPRFRAARRTAPRERKRYQGTQERHGPHGQTRQPELGL